MSGMVINTNVAALNAWRNLSTQTDAENQALNALSSGQKVNSAADNASGWAIAQKMQGQINGMTQAQQNANDGISLLQTANGSLTSISGMIQTLRQLAVQAQNSTTTQADRGQIQKQVSQLVSEIQRVATTTQFNTKGLLNGSAANTHLMIQVGANKGQVISFQISNMSVNALFGATGSKSVSLTLSANISGAINTLDKALSSVSGLQAKLGALQNRLTAAVSNLQVSTQNLQSAKSGITDADMASEMATFTKQQVLVQAGTAMLAQANQESQGVLKLLS